MMKLFFSLMISFCSFVFLDHYVSASFDYKKGLFDLPHDDVIQSQSDGWWHLWHDNYGTTAAYPNSSSGPIYKMDHDYTMILVKPLDITGMYIYSGTARYKIIKTFYFYDSNNRLLGTEVSPANRAKTYMKLDYKKVKKIVINKPPKGAINELEFFINPASLFDPVTNISTTSKTDTSAILNWKNALSSNNTFFRGNKIYLNDQLLNTSSIGMTSYALKDLTQLTKYKVTVSSLYYSAVYGQVEVPATYYFTTLADTTPPGEVKSLNINHQMTNKKAEFNGLLTYVLPTDRDFSHVVIYRDGTLLKDNMKSTQFTDTGLKEDTEYLYKVHTVDKTGNRSEGVSVRLFLEKDRIPPADVTDLKVKQLSTDVNLTYKMPTDRDFSHVRISRNNVVIADNVKETTFVDVNAKENTTYTYKVQSVDVNENVSEGEIAQIEVSGLEVNNLSAEKTYNKVTLSWKNPTLTDFEQVTIYRKNNGAYTPLFTTSGTIFEDTTVKSGTSYNYLVTTFIDGSESDGKVIDVKTPKVTIEGDKVQKNDDNYTITWNSPTTGKIKVIVGDVDYKIVAASDLKVVIPKKDMVLNKFDNPDVKLVPVDESGNAIGDVGAPGGTITWGGIDLGILGMNVKSFFVVIIALLGLIGGIVLLAMSFKMIPKLIDLLIENFR